jgi:DNA-binding NarL/FixJ family response regulator
VDSTDQKREYSMMSDSKQKPTIVIADDHAAILRKASEILQQEFAVQAEASDGISALKAVTELNPAVLILDIAMPGLDGIQVARRVRELGIGSNIVFLTVQDEPECAAHFGASFVLKPRMHAELSFAVREALAGRRFVSADAHTSQHQHR